MPLEKRPVQGLYNVNQLRRDRETLNKVLDHQFDDSKRQTTAEKLADVSPVNYAYSPYNVLRNGADNTGATDAKAAIETAIEVLFDQGANHTEAAQIGGVLRFPIGEYLLDSTVAIGKDGIVIEGDPGGGTVIRTSGAFPAFTVQSDSLQKIYGVVFRNIRFVSDVTGRTAGSAALKFISAEVYTVENCVFHLQTLYAIWQIDCITGRILNNQFDSSDWNDPGIGYAIYSHPSTSASLAGGNNATLIFGNSFRRTASAAISMQGEPISDSPTTLRRECSGLQVVGNHFEHNYGNSIELLRNRAWMIEGNWFEQGGLDAASGRGYIVDIATDDDEGTGGANSGVNASVSIRCNVFGGHDSAHADFEHIGLAFTQCALIESNYFTAGIIGITSTCRGLTIRNNWSSQGEPTLAGTIPTSALIRDNFDGPTASATAAARWIGDFHEYDGTEFPQVITSTSNSSPSILDTTFGKIKRYVLAATGALTITNFDDADHGDILELVWANANTTLQNTTGDNGINLAGQANFTGATKDTMVLMYVDGNSSGFTNRWMEISRRILTPQTYTVTNATTDRAFDCNATTVDELADVVATLIADLKAQGITK